MCGSLPVVIVGTVRYLPTICFDRPALDVNATQLHVLYVLRRYGIVWYNINHVAIQNSSRYLWYHSVLEVNTI